MIGREKEIETLMIGLGPSDMPGIEASDDRLIAGKSFRHKSFEERLAEYNNEITIYDFDWGEPLGMEMNHFV
ncbi:MAG: hypothetical protein K6G58_03220 [Lachnospiraceae bacterium]|nr:hypothetical protein [Lachnospiraceae bacterium]